MQPKAHTLMLLANGFLPDPRVHKEARSLIEAGYAVTIICLDRDCDQPAEQVIDSIRVVRIRVGQVVPGKVASVGKALAAFYALALPRVVALHRKTPFKIIHCHDFDTVPLGLALRPLLRAPVVYDMHDLYASFFAEGAAQRALQAVDRQFYRLVDGQVLVNARFETVEGVDTSKSIVVMNVPGAEGAHRSTDTSEGLFYAGNLDLLRDMRYAFPTFVGCGMRVVFAGEGGLMSEYQSLSVGTPVELLGRISPREVYERTSRCLAVLALYDTRFENNRFASPNKLFDAMKYGKPSIVSAGSVMADIATDCDCGIAVPYGDAEALAKAITRLRDPDRYARMCENAYAAFIRDYNWGAMVPRLVGLYERLMAG
jgi:glycosyltransferase involved in cell wall biosynthesis